jgi:hypothetical protein
LELTEERLKRVKKKRWMMAFRGKGSRKILSIPPNYEIQEDPNNSIKVKMI